MYDIDKAQLLEKQSHVRGALSKEFYSNQQSELERKRKEMKRILDEQVEERKRVKEREKQQQEARHRKEEEEIKRYYENVEQRERRISEHSSVQNYQTNNKHNESTFNNENESLVRKHVQQQSIKQKVVSKTQIHEYDIGNYPLMPLMSLSEAQFNGSRATNGQQDYNTQSDRINSHNYYTFEENAGNIPLLDLSDEGNFMKNKKKSKTMIRKEPSERENNHLNNNQTNRNNATKLEESKYNNNPQSPQSNNKNILVIESNQPEESIKKKERQRTLSNDENMSVIHQQQNMLNSRMSKGSKVNENIHVGKSPAYTKRNTEMDIPEEIEQIETENRQLKESLKKSQEAISLLIGAVRSNPKLDKFRVQAEKILHHQSENYPKTSYHPETKFTEKKEESPLMLPKIKVKYQSIMHDYLFEAAKRAKGKQIKSQTTKH